MSTMPPSGRRVPELERDVEEDHEETTVHRTPHSTICGAR
jgi:hypothetical protein